MKKPLNLNDLYHYTYEVFTGDSQQFTASNLETTLTAIFNDDELLFRDKFVAQIIVKDLTFQQLLDCVARFLPHDFSGTIADSSYCWQLTGVVKGDKHPEVHVLLTAVN